MPQIDLNTDVLLNIAAFLPREDLSRLTRTCRLLHDTALPALLQDTVRLTRWGDLASFSQFMHIGSTGGTGKDLFPFLRSLQLDLPPAWREDPASLAEWVKVFTDLLRQCWQLVTLAVHHVSATFAPKQLRLALAAPLPALQDLTLKCVTDYHQDVLADVASRLRTVRLSMSITPGPGLDPSPFLRHHRSTITTLELSHVCLGDLGVPLPGVRKLISHSFSLYNNRTGWAGPLIHMFPNVEHVELRSLRAREGITPTQRLDLVRDPHALEFVNEWRLKSEAWQVRHGTWKNGLRFLSVLSFADLYCLALACPISQLCVRRPEPSQILTAAALADARPRCLAFPIATPADVDYTVPFLLAAVALSPSVTHLTLELGGYFLQGRDLKAQLALLGNRLRQTAVTHLFLNIGDCDVLERDSLFCGPLVGGPSASVPAEGGAHGDVPQLLQIIGHDNPTLHRIFVSFGQNDVRAWEACQRDGGSGGRWGELGQLRTREVIIAELRLLEKVG